MEMHQLRYVVAISRAGNFSRAAEQCHVSQPSLSQQKFDFRGEGLELDFDQSVQTDRYRKSRFLRGAVILDCADMCAL